MVGTAIAYRSLISLEVCKAATADWVISSSHHDANEVVDLRRSGSFDRGGMSCDSTC